MRKGMSVAMWIWIIGGVIIAGLLFVMVIYNVGMFGDTKAREAVLDGFRSTLVKNVDVMCASSVGSVIPVSLDLKNVQAIYAADKPENADPKAPLYITQKNYSTGNYLCLSFDTDEFRCEEFVCDLNVTYMGTPMKTSDMYKIGITDGSFTFAIQIKKTEPGKVLVSGTHIP